MTDIIQALSGFALTLFLPGYAFILALYPRRKDLGKVERIAISSVMSIAITLCAALFLDTLMGLDFTGDNMIMALILFTVLCLLAWAIRVRGRF
jgi:uncharacterized membrane protein